MVTKERVIAALVVVICGLMLGGCASPSSQFCEALRSKDPDEAKLILSKHPDLANKMDKNETYPLMAAAFYKQWDVVRFLLAKGADVNVTDYFFNGGYTVLHYAAEQGNREMVTMLLAKGADVNFHGPRVEHVYPLDVAADSEIADLLRKEASIVQEMHEAVKAGNLTKVKSVFADKPTLVNSCDKFGFPLLYTAVDKGHKDIVDFLIANGAKVDFKRQGFHAYTPLQVAVYRGDKEIAELLIANGASVDLDPGLGTPLHYAAYHNQKEIAELLIAKGADVNLRNGWGMGDRTPLDIAAEKGNPAIAKLLIANGAKVNGKCHKGFTALHFAAGELYSHDKERGKGEEEVGEILIANGANANAKASSDKDYSFVGWTPLHVAAYQGHEGVIKLLLANGAKVSARATDHVTPLHNAVDKNHKEVVKILLEHGASVNAKTRKYEHVGTNYPPGSTPLALAVRSGHKEIADLLRKHGAKE